MTNLPSQRVLWVRRNDADAIPMADPALRKRAGIEDPAVEVHTEVLGRWSMTVIPARSRDEWGAVLPEIMNLGYNQLPPEGRVYVIDLT